jgi:hypothetical protein
MQYREDVDTEVGNRADEVLGNRKYALQQRWIHYGQGVWPVPKFIRVEKADSIKSNILAAGNPRPKRLKIYRRGKRGRYSVLNQIWSMKLPEIQPIVEIALS